MVTLRARMRDHLIDWPNDLDQDWRAFFAGCPDLDFAAIPENILVDNDTVIWPGRRIAVHPEAPAGSHICRAFDGIAPRQVRLVVLGQDPYPAIGRATGRAFEDGDWNGNDPSTVAESLRRLLQSAAASARPDLNISDNNDDWATVCDAVRDHNFTTPASPGFFDALARQGVLSVNAAWTFTSKTKEHLNVHIGVWKAVLQHLILRLVQREHGEPIVFLLLGTKARDRFRAATWRYLRANPGYNIETVFCAHPTAWTGRTYFDYENPLKQVNRALVRLASEPVCWWPSPVDPGLLLDP